MENIKSVVFLDDACDGPDNLDWDCNVSEGEIPLVIYDALEDYLTYPDKKYIKTEELSVFFYEFLERYIEDNKWDEDYLYMLLNDSIIHYSDGRIENFKDRVVEVRTVEFSKCCCDLGLSRLVYIPATHLQKVAQEVLR